MDITTIVPIRAFQDNYIWCLRRGSTAAIVDPGDAAPVLEYLADEGLQLAAILTTHHHGDHVGGNTALLAKYNVPVFGPAREDIPGITRPRIHAFESALCARRRSWQSCNSAARGVCTGSPCGWQAIASLDYRIRTCSKSVLARGEPCCGSLGQSLCGPRSDESGRRLRNAAQMEGWILARPAAPLYAPHSCFTVYLD